MVPVNFDLGLPLGFSSSVLSLLSFVCNCKSQAHCSWPFSAFLFPFDLASVIDFSQDGNAAGQTVPHVHFHLLPRKFKGDRFSGNNDEVYPALEQGERSLKSDFNHSHSSEPLKVDADDKRLPRTIEEMEKEAIWLKSFFEEEKFTAP
ncbi:hypothetical protein BDQ17DRAFT_1345404 [Cyathus striatus]|nr:hypothetical protein BDQ17DRAFT_1345404 [Cyathus striatus]